MADLLRTLDTHPWHSEPPHWQMTDAGLSVTTGDKTDFWQDTLYGFRRDDGHFLGLPVEGDFTAILAFEAEYDVLYDQAGLMIRSDAENWLKTGIEFSDGVQSFSTVVTREGRSDWSVSGQATGGGVQRVRLTRQGSAVITHHSGPDGHWHLMRLADFPGDKTVTVGSMTCSPERAGLVARFTEFEVGPVIESPLHAS